MVKLILYCLAVVSIETAFAAGLESQTLPSKAAADLCPENLNALPVEPFAQFSGTMRIMTPKGDIPIHASAAGDSIWSYDVDARKYVHNVIEAIIPHEVDAIGILQDRGVDIEVASTAIESMDSKDILPGYYPFVRGEHHRPVPHPLTKGRLEIVKGSRTVHEIKLRFSPHTYFVEGLLVHDSVPKR